MSLMPGTFRALASPGRGQGIPAGMKHVTWAHCPENGRLYAVGGDYSGLSSGIASYRQEVWSLDLRERLASPSSPTAGWRLEYPYCGPAGGVQPKSPDFVGWAWDPGRRWFWCIPGQYMIPGEIACPGRTVSYGDDPGYKANHLMAFRPFAATLADRWWDITADAGPDPTETWMSVYDAPADRLARFGWNGGSGAVVNYFDCAARRWLPRRGLGLDARLNKEHLAHDSVRRAVYAADGMSGRLFRWDLAAERLANLGSVPGGAIGQENYTLLAWDPVRRVLLFKRPWTPECFLYHADEARWETLTVVTQPSGLRVVARTITYDPAVDAFLLAGGLPDEAGPGTPANPYLFLYQPMTGGTSMKTATYNVVLGADAAFPAGTPTPTDLRARAETGPVPKSPVTVPWSSAMTAAALPMLFDEAIEAGSYNGYVDLMSGSTVLSTIGPVAFIVPSVPVSVTYRAPTGFTVTVG